MTNFTQNTTQMFLQKSLADVLRKWRNTSGQNQEGLLEQFVNETQKEINSPIRTVKVMAIQKAMYFHMLGYSAEYANFTTVEIMSDSTFVNKRLGYVAACTTFRDDADVLPLTPALLRRDLNSSNQYVVGLALYYIATICTPELARDLVSDVVQLLQHPSTYVRKKAVLSLYKIFLEFPESLRPIYPKLREKLEDTAANKDTGSVVRGAVVCVLCELARRNPSNYLSLGIPFYSLLFTIHSNWTLIKIIKVFGHFAQSEPRLCTKLAEPLTNLITTTTAKSVQYECILAVANGMNKVSSLTKLAVDKMRLFVEDADQNLKCLGLHAMSRLSLDNPKVLMDHRDIVLSCLKDADIMIRCKALKVLRELVTPKSIMHIIDAIADAAVRIPSDEEWTNTTIATIVEMAQTDDYGLITNFEWYLSVLIDLSAIEISVFQHGSLLERELVTILTRVSSIRQFGVETLSKLLNASSPILKSHPKNSTQWRILGATAFACGEYPYWLRDRCKVCEDLLSEKILRFPPDIQLLCVSAVGKIIAYTASPSERHVNLYNGEEQLPPLEGVQSTTLEELRGALLNTKSSNMSCISATQEQNSPDVGVEAEALAPLDRFRFSVHPGVQEYAILTHYLLTQNPYVGTLLYGKELPLVALGAQSVLEIPDDVDLDHPLCEDLSALMALSSSDDDEEDAGRFSKENNFEDNFDLQYHIERQQQLEQARRDDMSAFYLDDADDALVDRPLMNEGGTENTVASKKSINNGVKGDSFNLHKSCKKRPGHQSHVINRDLLKPHNYVATTKTREKKLFEEDEATRRLRKIDVTLKLSENERLPETLPYSVLLGDGDATQDKALKHNPERKTLKHEKETFNPPPVTLCDEHSLQVVLYTDRCKIRTNEIQLYVVLEVSNLSDSSALQEAALGLKEGEGVGYGAQQAYADGSLVLEPSRDKRDLSSAFELTMETTAYAKSNKIDTTHLVPIAKMIKTGATARVAFSVRLTRIPSSLTAPLPLSLVCTRNGQLSCVPLQMPFQYAFFIKPEPPRLTVAEFNRSVLGSALKEATTASAFIPCNKATLLIAVPLIRELLRLVPMDIFKDMATLYGTVHASKSTPDNRHVAVLLCEMERDQAKGIDVNVRTGITALAELLIYSIVEIIQSSLVE
ncbi:unnamed protein product [Phytomonas sp. EM1]|nr:unnamed protein product [Phytomonas sp. EM1]|eukprot:CCW60194.1 unnamed protein product [Phytomonas sp. isolate EM1]